MLSILMKVTYLAQSYPDLPFIFGNREMHGKSKDTLHRGIYFRCPEVLSTTCWKCLMSHMSLIYTLGSLGHLFIASMNRHSRLPVLQYVNCNMWIAICELQYVNQMTSLKLVVAMLLGSWSHDIILLCTDKFTAKLASKIMWAIRVKKRLSNQKPHRDRETKLEQSSGVNQG